MAGLLKKYWKFPVFNFPYSVIGAFSKEFPIFLFTFFGDIKTVGYYALMKGVLYAPIYFISASIGQVFFQKAVEQSYQIQFKKHMILIMETLLLLALPFFVITVFHGQEIFGFLFGEQWKNAGLYASYFSPVIYMMVISSWPERLYDARGKQHIPTVLQITSDIISIGGLGLIVFYTGSPLYGIAYISGIYTLYHILYVYFLLKVGEVPGEMVRRPLLIVLSSLILLFSLYGCLYFCALGLFIEILLSIILFCLYYFILYKHKLKHMWHQWL